MEKKSKIEKNLKDLIEIVVAIKDGMASKEDIKGMVTKDILDLRRRVKELELQVRQLQAA